MSNKASDSLFHLIKSLTKGEKRYFKVSSSRHVIGDKNNYQILFDAIDKQTEYDEKKLLIKFKNEPFIKRFSIAKSRLYILILRSLDGYYAKSSVEAQLKRQIHHGEILFNKSLYDQSLKIFKSAKKTAEKHELAASLMEIGKWEKRIIEKDNYENTSEADLEAMHQEDQNIYRKIGIYNNLWHVKSLIIKNLYSKGKIRSGEELAKFKEIIDRRIVENTEESMYAENQYLLNHIYSAYHFGLGDYKESYQWSVKNINLIESKPFLFKEEPNVYLSVLTNAIHMATKLNQTQEAFEYMNKLKALPKKLDIDLNEDREIRFFAIVKSTELNLCIDSGEFERGKKLVIEIEEGLLKYHDKLSSVRKAFFYFTISNLYFETGEYNEALKWINQLLNYIDIDETQEIHCMAQLYNLILHIELGNKSLLPYTFKSTERFLETRQRVYKFETIFLKFIKNLLRKKAGDPKVLYQNLAKETSPLLEDPFESRVFEYFDFYGWIQGKIQTMDEEPPEDDYS